MSTRVAFIGLGHMGGPMCARVAAAGFAVTAYDLRPGAVEAAVAAGATGAASASAAASAAEVVVTMLPGPAQVEDVLTGSGGALEAMSSGALVIDMSTSSADVGRRVAARAAARGVAFVDAPVADALRAAEGMLNIFAGGTPGDVARARPVLEAMGDPERIWHVGPAGSGYAVKLLVNLQWFVHAAAAAEALVVGARAGLNVRMLHGVLAAGPGRSSFIEHEALEVLEAGEYGERFPLGLVAKDLGLALELAQATGIDAPMATATRAIYEHARERFGDGAGEMAAVRLYEELAETELRFGASHVA